MIWLEKGGLLKIFGGEKKQIDVESISVGQSVFYHNYNNYNINHNSNSNNNKKRTTSYSYRNKYNLLNYLGKLTIIKNSIEKQLTIIKKFKH